MKKEAKTFGSNFASECDRIGLDNYLDACVDAPGVDRAWLHASIGSVALAFFDRTLGVRRTTPY